jgi:hypothetical protein
MSLCYKIIGISGNARCGKDTMGVNFQKVLSDLGIKSKRYSFAYELKKSVDSFLIEQLGISAFTENEDEKKIIRPFLVFWGTDVMRSINNNVWVERLESNLKKDHVSIITDLRFINELDWIKANKGFSLMIKRPGIEPANDYEKVNNEKMSVMVDGCFEIGNFQDDKIIELTSNEILNSLINEKTYKLWKATCH